MTRRQKGRRARHSRDTPSFAPGPLGTPGGMYRPLSEANVARIHSAALDVLENTGFRQPTDTVRDLALAAGCRMDDAGRLLFPRFPPDGCPMVGPVPRHPGLWLAAGFPVGIGTGGGAGKYLAEWMVNGQPPYALSIIDPARFGGPIEREECFSRMKATYAKGYITPDRFQVNLPNACG